LRKSIKSKGTLRVGHSSSRHARNPLTQQLPATYHSRWSGAEIPWPCFIMIKREEMVIKTDKQLICTPEPTGF